MRLYEEVFLTGCLPPAFAPFGAPSAMGAAVLIRVLYHVYQGPLGVMSVIAFGGVAGAYFWRTRKLWPVVFAHNGGGRRGIRVRIAFRDESELARQRPRR